MMTDFPSWLQEPFNQLTQSALVQRGHAFLLLGPMGLGQQALVASVAQTWLSSHMADHPDMLVVEALEGKRDIGVDQIRELSTWAQQTSHGALGRVVVIRQLERLNAAAANSLLKTLEEPPAGVRFLLTASRSGKLLPTLLSRCQRLNLPIPSQQLAMQWLQTQVSSVSESDCQLALQLHMGAPLAAQNWLISGGLTEWKEWQALWQVCHQKRVCSLSLIEYARKDAQRFCRLLAAQAYVDGQDYDRVLPWQLLRLVWQVENALGQNVNKDLLVDNLLQSVNQVLLGQLPNMKVSQRRGVLA
jgi:DNA polymerase-3 subunit delta'